MSNIPIEYKLREFTVAEYHQMAEIGVLGAEERVELLDGALVEMSPIGRRHWRSHAAITAYLNETLSKRALIVGQGSFPLGRNNEPQPDIAILATGCADPSAGDPLPDEIYAVIEIADSSLGKDTGPKLRLYARFGIPDYLVVDLAGDILIHYHDPHELGYRSEDRLHAADTFTMYRLAHIALSAAPFLRSADKST
jgi:Uma2 family endonuclease